MAVNLSAKSIYSIPAAFISFFSFCGRLTLLLVRMLVKYTFDGSISIPPYKKLPVICSINKMGDLRIPFFPLIFRFFRKMPRISAVRIERSAA